MRKEFDTHVENKIKKCGTITCINNADGYCNAESCELFERTLMQEH